MLPLCSVDHRFPCPDWNALQKEADRLGMDERELQFFWAEKGKAWAELLRESLGEGYGLDESSELLLICNQDKEARLKMMQCAERALKTLLFMLRQITDVRIHGKIVMLVVGTPDEYYEYIANYYSDGEYGASSGIYINEGYGHFVLVYQNAGMAEAIIAHELTHALLCTLPIPMWLNEGITQLAEQTVTRADPTPYEVIKHQIGSFWDEDTIQDLWSGRGFKRADEGQLLSYHLAMTLTRLLLFDPDKFRAFVNEAHCADAGNAALEKYYDFSLHDLVFEYLGEGNWDARPTEWDSVTPA